jgi:chorismate mutase/prephenate dehydratase
MIDEARQHPEASGQVDWQQAAAIGPYSIVDHAQLPLFCKDIEDHHGNTTRFYVIGKHDSPPSGEDRTALVMSIRDEPGALHMLIKPLASRGIGLTRIESRPSKRKLWEYVFFIDLIGHRDDAAVAEALDEIRAMPGTWLKVLGSYPVSRKL